MKIVRESNIDGIHLALASNPESTFIALLAHSPFTIGIQLHPRGVKVNLDSLNTSSEKISETVYRDE